MTHIDKLDRLCRIARLLADRSLAPVAQAQQRAQTAEEALGTVARHRASLVWDDGDAAYAAAAAKRLLRLRHIQAARLADLAAARAEVEIAKAAARPALGRQAALEALRDAAARNAKRG